MTEFLVSIQISVRGELDSRRLDELRAAELEAGRELIARGVIHRIWRLPGTTDNVGIWRAADASELHSHLAALPLFPYMQVQVTPLAIHPLEVR